MARLSNITKWGIVIIVALLLFIQVPDCHFPEEEIATRAPVKADITKTQTELEKDPVTKRFFSGLSMYPSVKPDQVCTCVKEETYKENDIITYYKVDGSSVRFIAHRVVEKLPFDRYITKGDGNLYIDPWIVEKDEVFCKIAEIPLLEKIIREGI